MEHNDSSVTSWVAAVQAGDQEAADKLWQRYFEQLVQLANRRLTAAARRVNDGEDVALSALDSFFQAARAGRFPHLDDRDNLWRLLLVITARKAATYNEREGRQRRGGGAVRGESGLEAPDDSSGTRGIDRVVGNSPTPEFLVRVTEEFDNLIESLADEKLREVARLRMASWTNQEIADQLSTSLRSVTRKLRLIRSLWMPLAEGQSRPP